MNSASLRSIHSLFDPTRLRLARQAAMLRKKDVAERIGVSAAAVSQYEKGSTTPSPKTIAALALALGTPVEFFASDRPLGQAPNTPANFRSLRATTQQERDRAFAHALLTWDLVRMLQRYVRFPTVALPEDLALRPDEPIGHVEAAARRAREALDLGTGPIPNVVRLLESRGVVCTRLPPQTRRVYAFSCAFPGHPTVVLSAQRTHQAAGRFDAAHELAHLLLHQDEEPGSHAMERQAHAFAAEFLAPACEIAEQLPATANWQRLLELKQIWGISIQALLFRARSLGVVSEHRYRRAITELSARGWRAKEPGDDGQAEQPVLLAKAVELLAERGMTRDYLAREARLGSATVSLIVGADKRPSVAASR
jgi:Zn-dependent peptidase ImmA (M78 family)/transcriptional regulator with XRE-family HTH domain